MASESHSQVCHAATAVTEGTIPHCPFPQEDAVAGVGGLSAFQKTLDVMVGFPDSRPGQCSSGCGFAQRFGKAFYYNEQSCRKAFNASVY